MFLCARVVTVARRRHFVRYVATIDQSHQQTTATMVNKNRREIDRRIGNSKSPGLIKSAAQSLFTRRQVRRPTPYQITL